MTSTTDTIFEMLVNITKDVGDIKALMAAKVNCKDYKKDKKDFREDTAAFIKSQMGAIKPQKSVNWLTTLKNAIYMFAVTSGFGAGVAAAKLNIFG